MLTSPLGRSGTRPACTLAWRGKEGETSHSPHWTVHGAWERKAGHLEQASGFLGGYPESAYRVTYDILTKKNNKKTESSSETEGLSDFDRVSSFSVSRFHFKKSVQVVKPDRQQWLLSRSRTKCVIDSRPHIKTICGPETLLCFQR